MSEFLDSGLIPLSIKVEFFKIFYKFLGKSFLNHVFVSIRQDFWLFAFFDFFAHPCSPSFEFPFANDGKDPNHLFCTHPIIILYW